MTSMKDVRRAARIQARMWVRIAGFDSVPQLRRGDISLTGVFFETDTSLGNPGAVIALQLMSFNKKRSVEVMARVVRVVAANDLWAGPGIAGVGLEFLAGAEEKRRELQQLVGEIVGAKLPRFKPGGGESTGDDGPAFVLHRLTNHGMVLETAWPVTKGETIRLEIQAPASGRRLRIHGAVVESTPMGAGADDLRHKVEVSFEVAAEDQPTAGELPVEGVSLTDALSVLLEETFMAARSQRQATANLHGDLAHIPLPSLLGFIELERLTGALRLENGPQLVQARVREGRVLTVEADMPGNGIERLLAVTRWRGGSFELVPGPVDVVDQMGMTTTGLIMELARLFDEQGG